MSRIIILLCILSIIGFNHAFGAVEPVNKRIQGTEIYNGRQLNIQDNKLNKIMAGNWQTEFEVQSAKGKIVVGIDESSQVYKHNPFQYRFNLYISYKVLENGILITKNLPFTEFDIDYHPARGTKYTDRAVKSIPNALEIDFRVVGIMKYDFVNNNWIPLPSNESIPDFIFIESEIETERYYHFDQTVTPPSGMTLTQTNGELLVNWPYIDGAEYYELEWTWVNGYSGNIVGGQPEVLGASACHFNFDDNSTRIRTQGENHYAIPLIYGDGYIVVRYRGIGMAGDHFTIPIEGKWNDHSTGIVSAAHNFQSVTAHEQNAINYGAGISFIENGVKSVGVTYMDGVLKPRQSQAKLNSQSKIIAGSTIYDHYGRPAIGVMSAPVNQNQLGYIENLNMHADGTPYGKEHFDFDPLPTTLCDEYNTTPPMNSQLSEGAAKYYSPNNTDIEGSNAYLPDAKGYPFAQVKYSNDPTGRIKRVGGVGPDHQFGKTDVDGNGTTREAHYTEYHYTTPDDLELYKLFGNDVSSPENYTKIITKDVHGQISVAISDPMGRNIATYLTGPSPDNLEALEDNNGNEATGKDFMLYNTIDDIEGILEVQHPIYVADPSLNYDFNYDFTAIKFNECLPLDICFDCIYEVEIRIIPEEFNPDCHITDENNIPIDVIDGTNTHNPGGAVIKTYTVGSIVNFNNTCTLADITFSNTNANEETFVVNFPKDGTYQIVKTLKVSRAPIDYYWEQYVEHNTNTESCLKPFSDFLGEAMDNINTEFCDEMDPCLYQAYVEVGDEEDYIENWLIVNNRPDTPANRATAAAEYQNAVQNAVNNCGIVNSCDVMYEVMVNDFKLGGQYALPNLYDQTSIFNTNNTSVLYPSGLDITDYLGNILVDTDGDGIPETPANTITNNQVLIDNWDDEWAELFVHLHPEYCYYSFCSHGGNEGLYEYERDMLVVQTYSEACNSGYLNPLGTITFPEFSEPSGVCYNGAGGGGGLDPLYLRINTPHPIYATEIQALLDTYDGTAPGPIGIFEHAVQMAGDDFTQVTFGTGCNKDLHWQMFRNLYLSIRFQIIEYLKEDFVLNSTNPVCSPYATCIGDPTCVGTIHFANKVKRYINYENGMDFDLNSTVFNPTTASADASAYIQADCQDQCEALADQWMTSLSGCANSLPSGETWEAGQTTYDNVRAALINVCAGGCGPEWPAPTQNNPDAIAPNFASFEAVVLHYLGAETVECSHLNILTPGPNDGLNGLSSNLTACACNLLLPTNDINHPTDLDHFVALHGYIPENFDAEKCHCESFDLDGNDVIEGTEITSLEAAQIPTVNYHPSCEDVCIDCGDLTDASTGYIQTFLTDYSNHYYDYPILFEAYVNEKKGSNYTYQQLLELIENCEAITNTGSNKIKHYINPKANRIKALIEKLNVNGLGVASTTDYDVYTLPEYFTTSLFASCNIADGTDLTTTTGTPAVPMYTYQYTPVVTSTSVTFNIEDEICSTGADCQIVISVASADLLGYTGIDELMDNCVQFGDVYHLSDQLNSGTLNEFYIDILVTDQSGNNVITKIKITSCYDVINDYTEPGTSNISFQICTSELEEVNDDLSCLQDLINQAEVIAEDAYNEYLTEQYLLFKQNYITTCTHVIDEQFSESHFDNAYQRTLMYYDLAGNLVKTVPPKAVYSGKLDAADAGDAKDFYNGSLSTPKYPVYATPGNANYDDYVTTYKYNTLNQIIESNTPDGGTTKYWYDYYGRLVLSQNAKQAGFNTRNINGDYTNMGVGTNMPAYSYTLYDQLGRVVEVGEIINSQTVAPGQNYFKELGRNALDFLHNGLTAYKNNMTRIYYDKPYSSEAELFFGNGGANELRNRISAVVSYSGYTECQYIGNNYDPVTWILPEPDYINHYSYDVHGNVKTYLQEIASLAEHHNRFRRTDYDYDLISGNPNYIYYQKGKPDQYIHHYKYDKDNRLSEVYTSKDGQVWDRDANYEYREDGYLARTELGEMKVQGLDFAYTLQGWLKTLNSGVLNKDNDMGRDGNKLPSAEYSSVENNIHGLVAKDALAYTLGYYEGDFEAISHNVTGYKNMQINTLNSAFQTDRKGLFNGNITSLITNLTDIGGQKLKVHANTFHYDQLHRFKEMHVFSQSAGVAETTNALVSASRQNLTTIGGHTLGDYEVHIDYDRNGNIDKLIRMAFTDALSSPGHDNKMDEFTYNYESNTNKLNQVVDAISTTSALDYGDIQGGQGSNNYTYHEDGSLKSDTQEEIAHIEWYPNGKIKYLQRDGASQKPDLYFEYDPMGLRTLKVEILKNTNGSKKAETDWKYTYYGTDANGTAMAIYDLNLNTEENSNASVLTKSESMVYGGARLGIDIKPVLSLENISNYAYKCNADGLASAILKLNSSVSGTPIQITVKINGVNMHSPFIFDPADGTLNLCEQLKETIESENPELVVNLLTVSDTDYYVEIKEQKEGVLKGDISYFEGTQNETSKVIRQVQVGDCYTERTLGNKLYELTNHLGNVMEVITDRKIEVQNTTADLDLSTAPIVSASGLCASSGNWTTETFNTSFTTTLTSVDFNADGEQDLEISNPATHFSGMVSVATVPDENYTLNYEILNTNVGVISVSVYECASGTSNLLASQNINSTGQHSLNFTTNNTATSVRIKWLGYSATGGTIVLSDVKLNGEGADFGSGAFTDLVYEADISSYSDYYPYGMQMVGRNGSSSEGYRYAFNGMEQDNNVSGDGNSYTTMFRQYDPRLGRWKSIDPLAAKFPWQSPFVGMDNNPIALTDVLGLETDKKGDEGNGDKVKDVERGDGRRNRARRESHYLKELAKKEGIDDYSITFKKDGGATMHYVEKDNTTVVLPNGSVFIDNGVVNVAPGPDKAKGLLGRIVDNIKSIAMDDTGYRPRQIVKVTNSTHSGKFEVQAYSGLDIMGQSVGQVSITQKVDDVTGFWDLSVSSSISYTGGFGVDIEANILERAYITILKPVKARNLADWANSGSQIQTHGWTWIYVNYTRLHGLDPKTKEAIWTGAGYGFGAGLGYSGSSGVNTFKPTGLMDEQDSTWKAAFDYKLYGRREYLKSKGIVTPKSIDSVKSTYYNK